MSQTIIHSNNNAFNPINLNLKTGIHENRIMDILKDSGADVRYTESLMNANTYEEFIKNETNRLKFRNKGLLDKEDKDMLDSVTEDQFLVWKGMLSDAIRSIEIADKMKHSNKFKDDFIASYKRPMHKILNGVFARLDKTKLTNEDRKKYKVDDLPEECWDIFYDEEAGLTYPIYYDYSTSNLNFVKFSKFLLNLKKSFDIKNMNHKAPLILLDRRLMGIDLDGVIPADIQLLVKEEARVNPFYHFREIARDKTKDGKLVKFELGLANWSVLWLYAQNFNIYHEAPRQTGKTYMICHIMAYEWVIGSPNIKLLFTHFKYSESCKNRGEAIKFANMYPRFLRTHILKNSTSVKDPGWKDSRDELPLTGGPVVLNQATGSQFKAIATGKSEQSGDQAGRGDSSPFIHIDEINFITYIQAVLGALTYANSAAREQALNAGLRSCMFFTSTPGTLNTRHGREMYDLVYNNMTRFHVELFGYSYDDLKSYLAANATRRYFIVKFDYDEMGFDEDWFSTRLLNSNTLNRFEIDILQRWLDVSEDSIFSQSELSRIRYLSENSLERVYFLYNDYKLQYLAEHPTQTLEERISKINHLAITIDLSEGQGLDSTAMYGMDLEYGEPIFMFNNNNIYALDMVPILKQFVKDLKKMNENLNIIIMPEIDGPGETIMPSLTRDPDIEKYMFRYDNPIDKKMLDYSLKSYARRISDDLEVRYGSLRMKTIRPFLIDTLFDLVKNHPQAFKFKDVAKELNTLRKFPNGKIAAENGFHDDNIMACLHAYSLLYYKRYRDALEKYHNFIVDYRKIYTDPIDKHTVYYESEKTYVNTEGSVSYDVVKYYDDEYRDVFEYINIYKVINGSKVRLNKDQALEEIYKDLNLLMVYTKLKVKPAPTTIGVQSVMYSMNSDKKRNHSIFSKTENFGSSGYNRSSKVKKLVF